MNCEKCGSENTQRLEVAYEAGTSGISAVSHTASVGSLSGALGLSGSRTKTAGVSQSALAQRASPPEKIGFRWPIILCISGLIVIGWSVPFAIFGSILIGLGAYWVYHAVVYNGGTWVSAYEAWQKSWICHKCGHIYHFHERINKSGAHENLHLNASAED